MTTAAADTIEKAKDIGRDTIDKGYEGAGEYASKSLDYAREVTEKVAEFAQRQPWVALAGGICNRLRCRANTQKAFVVNQMSLVTDSPDALSNLGQLALNIQRPTSARHDIISGSRLYARRRIAQPSRPRTGACDRMDVGRQR
jgi:ElaB/YqjD/DUF883 family membrane-anchored ribosome-binding protein